MHQYCCQNTWPPVSFEHEAQRRPAQAASPHPARLHDHISVTAASPEPRILLNFRCHFAALLPLPCCQAPEQKNNAIEQLKNWLEHNKFHISPVGKARRHN
jgi:hypothetical protein